MHKSPYIFGACIPDTLGQKKVGDTGHGDISLGEIPSRKRWPFNVERLAGHTVIPLIDQLTLEPLAFEFTPSYSIHE